MAAMLVFRFDSCSSVLKISVRFKYFFLKYVAMCICFGVNTIVVVGGVLLMKPLYVTSTTRFFTFTLFSIEKVTS